MKRNGELVQKSDAINSDLQSRNNPFVLSWSEIAFEG